MNGHCESCGGEADLFDSYTTCCNELACYGEDPRPWALGPQGVITDNTEIPEATETIEACCYATARRLAAARGLQVLYRAN